MKHFFRQTLPIMILSLLASSYAFAQDMGMPALQQQAPTEEQGRMMAQQQAAQQQVAQQQVAQQQAAQQQALIAEQQAIAQQQWLNQQQALAVQRAAAAAQQPVAAQPQQATLPQQNGTPPIVLAQQTALSPIQQAISQAQQANAQQQQVVTQQQTTVQQVAPPQTAAPQAGVPPQPTVTQQETTTTTVTNVSPPSATIRTPAQQMSLSQFQQWLQSNNYAQGAGSNPFANTKPKIRQPRPPQKPLTYEQGQQAMLNSVPASPVPQVPDADVAFTAMLQQNMPLSPQQVVQLRQQIDIAQRAAATPPNIPPKPVSSTIMVNLAPGTTPPAIRLAQGYVSALVFVDSTSQPWPIAAFDIGNPKAVNIQWDGKSNIILMQAVSAYSDGDIVIRLVGNPTPITLQLVAGQRVVDYRVDLHVPGIGPNTKEVPVGTGLPNNANQLLLGVLDGVAPAGSKTLMVHGADAQAWALGEKMYLRTRLTLLSPGWVGTMVSPDGMHAYELPRTSTVLVSRYGEPTELRVEGF